MLVPRGRHIERTVAPLERATDTELDQLRQRLSKTARGGPRDAISLGLDRDLVQREVAELRSMIAVAEKTQFAERCSHLDPVTPPPTAPRQRSRFAVDVNSTAAGSLLTVTPPPSAPRLTPALNTPALSLGLLRSAMRDEQAEFDSSSRKLGTLRGSTSTSSLLSLRPETAPAMLIVGPHCVGRASSGYAGRYCTSPPPGGSASLVVNHVSDIQPRMFRSPSFASITSSSSLSGLSLSSRPGPPALTSALALSSALAGAQSDASQSLQSVHATALAHQRALARAPPAEEPRARQERLREAFQDAISATPEDALSRALYGCAPSAGVLWDLQRRITSQLGLHALLTHALQLSATLPETIVLRRDTGAVELLEFTSFGAGASPKDVMPIDEVPFRLTRTLQQFITPLGIDGPFSGAFCAAAECLANQNKCPLPQWLDALARREGGPSGGDPDDTASAALAQGLVPWGCSGLKAAERVQNLSPVLLARSAAGNRPMADVHAKVRSLIDAATNTDNLCAMPSGWMAWL